MGFVKTPEELARIFPETIAIEPSPFDPWSEVEVVRVLGAVHMVGNNSMKKGKVVAEADPLAFAPFAFMKLDF